MHVHMCVQVCGGQRLMLTVFLIAPRLILRHGYPLEPEVNAQASLASQLAPVPLSLPSEHWAPEFAGGYHTLVTWVLRMWQGLGLLGPVSMASCCVIEKPGRYNRDKKAKGLNISEMSFFTEKTNKKPTTKQDTPTPQKISKTKTPKYLPIQLYSKPLLGTFNW